VSTTNYAYNGLGDRLREAVNGSTTDFTLDLNAGLTQVLSDGSYTYLYGNGRIAQVDAAEAEYFLADALGSVRQLVDANGSVQTVKSYEPYGEVLSSTGNGVSKYGFAGEWTDSYIKLLYLRSRYYSFYLNQFFQPDTIEPNPYNPGNGITTLTREIILSLMLIRQDIRSNRLIVLMVA
jgi:RHS repeat-associated protein